HPCGRGARAIRLSPDARESSRRVLPEPDPDSPVPGRNVPADSGSPRDNRDLKLSPRLSGAPLPGRAPGRIVPRYPGGTQTTPVSATLHYLQIAPSSKQSEDVLFLRGYFAGRPG